MCLRVWYVAPSSSCTAVADTSVLQKLDKIIPGTPANETPVHLREKQIYAHSVLSYMPTKEEMRERKEAATAKSGQAQ